MAITLAASAARTASGEGTSADLGVTKSTARLTLTISALSFAVPLFDVAIETSDDDATWRQVGRFTPGLPDLHAKMKNFEGNVIGAVDPLPQTERLVIGGLDRYVRARWTIVGPGSVTFEVAGDDV